MRPIKRPTPGNDVIFGSFDNDLIRGLAGHDVIYGEDGNDRLFGDNGNDTLYGGDGQDIVYGGNGNDVLIGDRGSDILVGGAGADRFIFADRGFDLRSDDRAISDRIGDFEVGTDKIDLRFIDANSKQIGDQAFFFTSSNAFTGQAGQLIKEFGGGRSTIISGDVDGDKKADFRIDVISTSPLLASDFLL
jgi:serralysin